MSSHSFFLKQHACRARMNAWHVHGFLLLISDGTFAVYVQDPNDGPHDQQEHKISAVCSDRESTMPPSRSGGGDGGVKLPSIVSLLRLRFPGRRDAPQPAYSLPYGSTAVLPKRSIISSHTQLRLFFCRQVKLGAHHGGGESHAPARRKSNLPKEEKGLVLNGKLLVQKEQVRNSMLNIHLHTRAGNACQND